MTKVEGERLAAVETQIVALQDDITEIKTDVKSLVVVQQTLAIALATKEAAELQHEKSRSQNGVWVRWLFPALFGLTNVLFAIYVYLSANQVP